VVALVTAVILGLLYFFLVVSPGFAFVFLHLPRDFSDSLECFDAVDWVAGRSSGL